MISIEISIAEQFSTQLFDEVTSLMPRLSNHVLTPAELETVVKSPSTNLFIASDVKRIVGMLTLVLVQIPSGLRAHIEDVVVATSHSRRGIGKALTRAAIDLAIRSRARTIDLTSRPTRIEAIQLYEGLGFQRRDSGVFRLALTGR